MPRSYDEMMNELEQKELAGSGLSGIHWIIRQWDENDEHAITGSYDIPETSDG